LDVTYRRNVRRDVKRDMEVGDVGLGTSERSEAWREKFAMSMPK